MPDEPLTILRFSASNVKRLRAVEIDPDGNLVVIAGRNGQGKTSVLDAIMWALGGARTLHGTERPIRDGQRRGEVTLDLGEYVVTRTFTPGGGDLSVTTRDGVKVSSPQQLLDGMLGRHAFDPFAFMRLKPKEQVATLLQVVPLTIDLDQLALERDTEYQSRLDVGRRRDKLRAQLDSMAAPEADTLTEEVPVTDLIDELRAGRAVIDQNRAVRSAALDLEGEVELMDDRISELEEQLDMARKALAQLQHRHAAAVEAVTALPPDPDLTHIEEEMGALDDRNRRARAAVAYAALEADWTNAAEEYRDTTERIEQIDASKARALEEAQMPIDGLSFDEDGLSFQPRPGETPIPLTQCAASEQLRVSVAIAVALNPRIRIARVTEGSLLDQDSMRLLAALADEHGFQLWVEVVDSSGKVGIVIEDGEVIARNPALAES